ncbi:hypothetical protein J008_04936 [Cryptococcus neoformans]|uniref:Expressed protein n=3 Tax=Cryptococcus neoformans species complex TaxID=1897064 RepID=Q5KBG8_CRYD1|nr:hypothetical protein CNAG_04290 [Cryptococcus neoformans var. grubii H99]XP_572688.1 expressed protein [Cryptococcus neoformans var. neoformans JEC21]XP_773793.1 hypothetical protein CNBH2450 [Cryptococcus neoformans var. neoformans B-3501A]AUB26997.1 hypothetical protein CKF44_04290 [Cryptococcus neoformans var. grubii]OWT37449.1 hypothetical protein C362_04463 [Cryptococcus neoformans var. grubii Bt1]OWZ29327.1 hypothetical protein C347_05199 [Cryptococcus neoformans var. grubii AD2-60a]|eukprot:XP_012051713.1 hypothetical protein CNAG_04290 [Cryptococcus neoformans var. grubii H99]
MPGPLYRDPWAAREAWRKSPIFSNKAMFRSMFPGLGTAIVAFTAYVIYDDFFAAKSSHGHAHGKEHPKTLAM